MPSQSDAVDRTNSVYRAVVCIYSFLNLCTYDLTCVCVCVCWKSGLA